MKEKLNKTVEKAESLLASLQPMTDVREDFEDSQKYHAKKTFDLIEGLQTDIRAELRALRAEMHADKDLAAQRTLKMLHDM